MGSHYTELSRFVLWTGLTGSRSYNKAPRASQKRTTMSCWLLSVLLTHTTHTHTHTHARTHRERDNSHSAHGGPLLRSLGGEQGWTVYNVRNCFDCQPLPATASSRPVRARCILGLTIKIDRRPFRQTSLDSALLLERVEAYYGRQGRASQ